MQARTAFRLAMLRNGFWPLLNDCKRSIEPGWPIKIPDETEVLSWDRSALTSTGLKIDGDLAVIDVDVSEADFRRRLGERSSTKTFLSCSRTDWCATPADLRKPGSRASMCPLCGSPRGAGIAAAIRTTPRCPSISLSALVRAGPGSSRSMGRTPATVTVKSSPPTSLPAALHRRRHLGRRCRSSRKLVTRWPAICSTKSPRRPGSPPSRKPGAVAVRPQPMCFELDADTEIETRDFGTMTVAELERLMRARGARVPMRPRRCAARAASTIGRGCGRTATSSTGAVTASVSTTP